MDNNTQLIKVPFAKDPVNLGYYDELVAQGITSFGIMNRVNRYGCEWESLVDNNTDAPAVWDGGDTITPSENWKLNAGNPEAWLMNHDKPATSEQYPFNGMGRIRLQKNLVEVEGGGETVTKNLLTQAMFEDGEGNPLTNTVYVIQYDFTLCENITVPTNCVLEFDGGSLSNGTLIGNNTALFYYVNIQDVLKDVTLEGTFLHNSNTLHNSIDNLFDIENIVDDPFFTSDDNWVVNNVVINKKLIVNGKGSASQTLSLLSGHRYLAVCYANITDVSHETKSSSLSFYGRYGIGFQIKDSTPVNGEYNFNIDFVGNREVSDYVPIIHVFDVYRNAEATVSFGEIYDGNGTITGNILHAGVYDVTDLIKWIPAYKDIYTSYKNFIKERIGINSSITDVTYPDSMCDLAFIEEMNEKAKYAYMNLSSFGTPSGLLSYRDKYNNGKTYKTIIPYTEKLTDRLLAISGAFTSSNPDTNVYVFKNLNPNLKYFIKNIHIQGPNGIATLFFYSGDDTLKYSYTNYNYNCQYSRFFDERIRNILDIQDYQFLNIPKGYTTLRVMCDNGYDPELCCISEVSLNSSSVELNVNDSYEFTSFFRFKTTISTAKDICILIGIAASDRKLQEIWNNNRTNISRHYTGRESDELIAVQLCRSYNNYLNSKYFRLYGKGGSYRTDDDETIDIAFAQCLLDRETGKWYSVCHGRYKKLPNYNLVDIEGVPTIVTDTVLRSDYPDVYARKILNTSNDNIAETLIKWYQEAPGYETFDPNTDIDWDMCAVCEIYPDMPFVYNEPHTIKSSITPAINTTTPYLWNYSKLVFEDGNIVDTQPNIINSLTKTPKNSSTAIQAYYLASANSSGVTPETQGWTQTIPQLDATNKYLWKYISITYSDDTVENTIAYKIYERSDDSPEISSIKTYLLNSSRRLGIKPESIGWVDASINYQYETNLVKSYSTVRGKNIDMAICPMSITKTMTSIVAMEYMNMSDFIKLTLGDYVGGSGNDYTPGEYLTLRSAIGLMMDLSDNSIATAICNQVGHKILESRYGK